MRISEEQIEQIRLANNIADVVGEYVQLKKRGKNLLGLCPFHKEKTPSFNVLEDRGIFKCFGCGKAGDVFRFVMEMEKLNFPEAVERLARKANITLVTDTSPEELREQSELESVYGAANAAYVWFFKVLRSQKGAEVMHYLSERGISHDTLREFGVGFAPPKDGEMMQALTDEGISAASLERAGLVSSGREGSVYERFRGRLIFPILSPTGRVVGFGGRVVPGIESVASQAKYINSPETSIYHKSRILFGLYQAKDAIRKAGKAYLVEGYLDVLAVSQAGIENVVAASGTSLTREQLDLLKRYAQSVVLLFDADQAGKNAAMRGIELALEAGFDVHTVILPQGEDPDSFIRKKGVEAFTNALKGEQSFIETKAQLFAEQGMLDDPSGQASAVRSIVESIAKIPDAIKQELFIRKLAGRFRISETTLLSELRKRLKQVTKPSRSAEPQASRSEYDQDQEIGRMESAPEETIQSAPEAERVLLQAALLSPSVAMQVIDRLDFDFGFITNPVLNDVLGHIAAEVKRGAIPDLASLSADYGRRDDVQHALIDSAMERESAHNPAIQNPSLQAALMAEQAIIKIMMADTVRRTALVRTELQHETDEQKVNELVMESRRLAERHKLLDHSFSDYTNH